MGNPAIGSNGDYRCRVGCKYQNANFQAAS